MTTDHQEDLDARLESGRVARRRRRRLSRRLNVLSLLLLLGAALAESGEAWLEAVLLGLVVALMVASTLVEIRHDDAAVERLARTAMWGLLALCLGTFGIAVGYTAADREIPPDWAMFGPVIVAMVVVVLASRGSAGEPEPTVAGQWQARGKK